MARLANSRRLPDGHLARAAFERLAPRLRAVGQMRGTVVRGLEPGWVLMNGNAPAAASLLDVVVSDPRVAFGEVLAQMHEAAFQRGVGHSAAKTLRRAYAKASGTAEAELAAFEAAGLLHRAYQRLRARSKDAVAGKLLRLTRTLVEIDA